MSEFEPKPDMGLPGESEGSEPRDNSETLLDRGEVFQELQKTKKHLEYIYGIDNLTTIEGVHLRHILERCMREGKVLRKTYDDLSKECAQQEQEGEAVDASIKRRLGRVCYNTPESVSAEAIAIWLQEMFGLHRDYLPKCWLVEDKTTGETFEYPYHGDEVGVKAREKCWELRDRGDRVNSGVMIASTAKAYIAWLRDQANNPEVE